MPRCHAIVVLALLLAASARADEPRSFPPDTLHWSFEGNVTPTEYRGRKCLMLDGAAAIARDFTMRDGVIDLDVATPATRGFFGVQFRVVDDGATSEWIYLRTHRTGYPDAIQYTPVFHTGANWQLYNGAGFNAQADIPRDIWQHVRVVVTGAQAKLYLRDMETPALVMNDLKTGVQSGQLALYVLTGTTYFANVEFRATPDAPWERHPPAMPAGTLTKWSLSPSYDALARDLERAPTSAERDTMRWQEVDAEPPGIVAIYRYRDAPHLRVTFQTDFSTRLDPQPGMRVVYARTTIDSDRDQVKKLLIGYSDDVSLFLNGRILYRGRSAQAFRDPNFLGIVNPENDTVYLPLKKGRNELLLAVSELGGGWGFICRLTDLQGGAGAVSRAAPER